MSTPTVTFACPMPGCDVFPYDRPEDLAEHVLAAHAGTPTPTVAPPAPTIPTPAPDTIPVQSFSPGGTRAVVRKTTTARSDAPTEAQKHYIRKLVAERPHLGATVRAACNELGFHDAKLTKRRASELIDRLRLVPKSAPTPEGAPARQDPPEGFHFDGTDVYKLQVSKSSGALYASVLDRDAATERKGKWDYVGRKPLHKLSDDTLLTLERARELGAEWGICLRCGALLTNPESVERGIGPVCAEKF